MILAKINNDQDASIRVQLLDATRGFTAEKLKEFFYTKRIEKPNYLRYCRNATVNGVDVEVAFLVTKGKEQGERAFDKTFLSAKYASFVGGMITGERVIDEKGNKVEFKPIQLTDYTEEPSIKWGTYEGKYFNQNKF